MPYRATDPITSVNELYSGGRPPHPDQVAKVLDHVDDLGRRWIARSTFVAMATADAKGRLDVSPKGDPAGFVHVLDERTLAIPDRPGNYRFDGFRNILETGRLGLVFLVPHRNEVLRVNGSAQLVRDAALCRQLAINGRPAPLAIVMDVEEAFFHCGKAIIRSSLWQADKHPMPDDLPTYAEALTAQTRPADAKALKERLEHNDRYRLYDD